MESVNKYTYRIFDNYNLICCSFVGQIGVDDIKSLLIDLSSEFNYSRFYSHVYDFRCSSLNINIEDLPEFVDFVKNEVKIDARRTDIYLTSKPNEVVLTTIFVGLVRNSELNPYIISSIERVYSILFGFMNSNVDISGMLNSLQAKMTISNNYYCLQECIIKY